MLSCCVRRMSSDGFCLVCLSACLSFRQANANANSSAPCEYFMLGDKTCQEECNIPECGYDSGDCENTKKFTSYTCDAPIGGPGPGPSPGGGSCYCNMLGDGTCNPGNM